MIKGLVPILKVNNRAQNLAFYETNLGLKVWQEENAFADLGGHASSTIALTLEESPSMRTRHVNGPYKLAQLVYRVGHPDEIEALLANGASYDNLYRGCKGWAFSSRSPEGHEILLHSEAQLSDLNLVKESPQFNQVANDFQGLSDLTLTEIVIRTPEREASEHFYLDLFDSALPLRFISDQGADLQVDSSETWDLAGFDVLVSKEFPMIDLRVNLESHGKEVFLDKKEHLLAFSDLNGLAVSFNRWR